METIQLISKNILAWNILKLETYETKGVVMFKLKKLTSGYLQQLLLFLHLA